MAVNFSYKNSGLKGGAYSNPQQVVNKEFEMYQKKQIQFQNQIDKSVSGISAKNALERASQEQLFADQNAEQRTQFDKVAGIKETGYGTFDQNMNNFFDGQTQKYFEIKGASARFENALRAIRIFTLVSTLSFCKISKLLLKAFLSITKQGLGKEYKFNF